MMTEFSFLGELLALHWPLHGSLKSVCSKKEITNILYVSLSRSVISRNAMM